MKTPILTTSISALVALFVGSSAIGAIVSFDGTGTASWDLPTNWSSNLIPQPADDLLINSTSLSAGSTETLDASYTVQSVSFDIGSNALSLNANASGTTAQTLTLTGDGGGNDALGSSGNLLDLSSATTGMVNIGVVGGVGTTTVSLGANGAFNIGNAAATLNFGANSIISGAFNLSQTGPGTLVLAGANTFGGSGKTFTLTSGTLDINNASALGSASNTFVINGGTISNTSGAAISTSNYAQTWGGSFTYSGNNALNLGTGSVAMGTASPTVTVNGAGGLTVGGVISGSGSLTKAGNGTLTLSNASSFSGGTIVNGGTLTLTAPTSGGGTAGVIRGALTINSGATVNANVSWGLGYSAGTNVSSIAINGGNLNFFGTVNTWGTSAANITMTGGSITGTTFYWYGGGNGNSATPNLNTNASASPAIVSAPFNLWLTAAGALTLNVARGTGLQDLIVSGAIGNNGASANGNLIKTGAGIAALTGANTYIGTTTINGGTLEIGTTGTDAASAMTVNAGTLQIDSVGKTLSSLTMNNTSAALAIAAVPGSTTTITNAFNQATNYTVQPIFASLPVASATPINLLTVSGTVSGTGVATPNFGLYGPSRVTGTAAILGNQLQLTVTNGAANLVWNNHAATGNWNVNTDQNFNNTGTSANDFFMSYDAVTFDDSTSATKTVNLIGTLAPTSVTVNTAGTYTLAGTGSLVGAGSLTISAGTLRLGDGVSNNGTVTGNIANSGTLVFANPNGQTYGGVISGTGRLVMAGPGTLTLSGINTYTGATTINGGTLALDLSARSGGIALPSAITINAGGTLQLTNTNTTVDGEYFNIGGTISGAGTMNKTGPGYLDFFNQVNLAGFTGQVNVLGGTLASNSGGFSTSSGKINLNVAAGASFDVRTGSAVIDQLSGSGTIGTTYIQSPLLSVGNNNGSSTFSGTIVNGIQGGTGTIALTKNGTGTLTLTGANAYTGATTINAGTLKLDFSAAGAPVNNIVNNTANTSVLTLGGTGTLAVVGSALAVNSQRFNGLTLNAGGSAIQLVTNAASQSLGLSLGAITRNAGATVDFALPSGTLSASNGIATTSGVAGTILTAGSGITYATVNGGSDWAAKDSTNAFIVPLSAVAGSYTPSTTTTLAGNADVASGVSATTLGGNSTLTSLRFNQPQATTVDAGSNTLVTGGILVTTAVGNNLSTITDGTLQGAGAELVILQNNAMNGLAISAVIADNSAATGLAKSGVGTVVLTGANTYTGGTTINRGILNINADSALGAANGGVTLAGGTLQAGVDGLSLASTRAFTLSAGTVGTIDIQGYSMTINCIVGGAGGLNMIGTGTLTLTGPNTYTGGSTVTAGTLKFDLSARSGTIALNALTVGSSGTLELFNTATAVDNTLLQNSIVSGGGTINKTGAGYEDFWSGSSIVNFTGTLHVMTGTMGVNNLGAGAAASQMTLNIDSGASFDDRYNSTLSIDKLMGSGTLTHSFTDALTVSVGNSNGSSTFDGVITNGGTGSLGLTKNGNGTLTLTGANTYNGGTTVSGGALVVSGSITGSTAVVNGGSLQIPSGGTVSNTAVTLNSGSIVANGAIANATTVNGGTLSGAGTVGGLVTVNTGGTLAPGQSGTGFLLLNSGLTLNSGGHLAFTLAGTSFGTQYPAVGITNGSVTLGGDLQLSLGYTPAVGDIFYVLVNQAGSVINGTFSNAVDQGNGTGLITAGGDQFLVSYTASYASNSFTGGQDIALKVVAVPEPGAYASLLGGLAMLAGLQRFRRRR